jgi:hypothetical protein
MGEEFYCILKLVSGEEILSLICIDENDGDPIVILQNPIIIKMIHNAYGAHAKVKPWIEMSDDDIFIIKTDKIITMTETNDKKLIDIYQRYLQDDSTNEYIPSGKVGVSTQMGYISSVEEARKRLENAYKGIKDL